MTARFIPVALVAAVFAITFLSAPRLGGGWFWDIGNGLGFVAFAGILAQMIPAVKSGFRARHETLAC